MSRLGQKIKELRTARGLSPKELGKKAGVSESYILEVEQGTRILNESLVTRLSKVLGVNLNENGDFYNPSDDDSNERKPRTVGHGKPQVDNGARNTDKSGSLHSNASGSAPSPQWESAFSNVIKDVPVYSQDMSAIVSRKKLVIEDNKVEGIPADKAFYIRIDESAEGSLKLKSGDTVLVHKTAELQTSGVYVINYHERIRICEAKPLNNNLILLGSGRGTLASETAAVKEVTVLGKCVKAEISL